MKNIVKTYGLIGKLLFALAGAIIGLLTGGLPLAVLGLAIGAIVGHHLAKNLIPLQNK